MAPTSPAASDGRVLCRGAGLFRMTLAEFLPPTLLLAPSTHPDRLPTGYHHLPDHHLPDHHLPTSIDRHARHPHFYSPAGMDKMLRYTQVAATYLFIRSIYSLSICLCASIRWPVHLSTHLPYLSPYLSISVHLSICMHLSMDLSIYLSISIRFAQYMCKNMCTYVCINVNVFTYLLMYLLIYFLV